MEELAKLRELLLHGEIENALLLVEDLEEMGKKGLTSNIPSYAKVLLLHLIKQQLEQRSTKSCDASIRNAITEIKYLNQRTKSRGSYLNNEELRCAILDAWDSAVTYASVEAASGSYSIRQIEHMVNKSKIIEKAYQLLR